MGEDSEQSELTAEDQEALLPADKVEQAIRLSYAQAMLGSIYVACTGGMFLIGYALELGADDVQIGLMSTIPMLCVVVQILSSMLIERGMSRRKMTIAGGLLSVLGWGLIISLPYVLSRASAELKISVLIGLITLLTAFAHVSGNARSSWIGDLIPASSRGAFFGRMTMYAGIIGAIFAVGAGRLLDHMKGLGSGAFNWLFLAGILFGLVNLALYFPQSDVPITKHESGRKYLSIVRETLTNKALMMVLVYSLVWSLQNMAGPFFATYLLRDLKMSYLGFGILGGAATLTMLASSPFWGRIVDRYGCRPVLIVCTTVIIPVPLVWIWMTNVQVVYAVIIPINLMMGFITAGVSVALNTLLYKVIPAAGRSVHLAVYSIIILLLVAPMPTIGGHLPGWLKAMGIHSDLRATFYCSVLFLAGSAVAAKYLREPDSVGTTELVRALPGHVGRRRLSETGE